MPSSQENTLFPFQATECLTTVKSVNKTDSQTLLATFGVRGPLGIPPDLPMAHTLGSPASGTGKGLGHTALDLESAFQSLEQLITASREDLALCPGLGPQKVRILGRCYRS